MMLAPPSPESSPSPEGPHLLDSLANLSRRLIPIAASWFSAATFTAALGFIAARRANSLKARELAIEERRAEEEHAARLEARIAAAYKDHLAVQEGLINELRGLIADGKEQLRLRDIQIDHQAQQIELQGIQITQMKAMNASMTALLVQHQILPADWEPADGLPLQQG